MKRIKKTVIAVVIALLLCILCFAAGRFTLGEGKNQKFSAAVLESQMIEISELATMDFHYTELGKFENSRDVYGIKVPFTTKEFVLSYEGDMKVGIDLAQAKVKVSGTTVFIDLPEVKILSHEIDENSIEIFDERTSIFNTFKVKDYQGFCKDQKAKMEKEAKEKGVYKEAQKNAEKTVKSMVSELVPEDYTIKIS